ncbi:serine hydrolase [Spirosoma validum]|uniref:Serine hydrolase n=1 Tax=Spirosoma validum TaxID=2771355 RepID=A0A927GH30_9BACT|nr:serine hydrolase [Spirosoma validum]MBD2757240.1 serine hydrolase [Spirosoma validum]
MKKHFTILLVWLASCLNTFGQKTTYSKAVLAKIHQVEQHLAANVRTPSDKDWTLQERLAYYRIPGISVAVIHNYQVEWAKAYGFADVAQQNPATSETRFQAGTLGQALNGVGMLTLVQDKKIDLFADINQYLTTWKFPYDSVTNGKKINTANLLSHTAGLPFLRFSGYTVNEVLPTIPQILDGHKPANSPAVRSRFAPDLRSLYSGGGLVITQQLLQDVTHQPYDQYMQERVLKPMGMIHSSFSQPPVQSSQLATGYDLDNNEIAGHYKLFPEQAAGGLWTTPTDLARYVVETQLAYRGNSSNVLTSDLTRLRLTPYVDSSFAMGVQLITRGTERYFTNETYGAGFSAVYYGSLTNGNGLVILANSDNASVNIIPELMNSIARVYNWPGFYNPTTRQTVSVPDSVLESYVGNYQLGTTVFTVVREKNKLFERGTANRAELIPETPTKFFFRNIDAEIEFVKDDAGNVVKRTMVYGGQKTEWKKIN